MRAHESLSTTSAWGQHNLCLPVTRVSTEIFSAMLIVTAESMGKSLKYTTNIFRYHEVASHFLSYAYPLRCLHVRLYQLGRHYRAIGKPKQKLFYSVFTLIWPCNVQTHLVCYHITGNCIHIEMKRNCSLFVPNRQQFALPVLLCKEAHLVWQQTGSTGDLGTQDYQ